MVKQRTRRAWLWRMRIGGALMVGACLAPVLIPGLPGLQWNWPLPGTVELGAILTALPGAALVALLAPLVSYRRRDALTVIFFPPAGLRVAWIIGTRLAQLPHRNWPVREDAIPIQGRRHAGMALAELRYRLWRHRRADRAAAPDLPHAQHRQGQAGIECGDGLRSAQCGLRDVCYVGGRKVRWRIRERCITTRGTAP